MVWLWGLVVILISSASGVPAGEADDAFNPVIVGVVINSCQGSITINVSSGQAPYTYEWRDGDGQLLNQTSRIITSLVPDDYSVIVTDAQGHTVSGGPYTITDPPDLVGNLTVKDVSCKDGNDGAIEVVMDNGNPEYDWTLFNSQNEIVGTGSEPSAAINVTGLVADNYIISFIDAHGCTGQLNFLISEPTTVVGVNLIEQTNLLCAGSSDGKITVEGTGGTGDTYTYVWSDSNEPSNVVSTSATATGLAAGTYTVVVTDENGCAHSEDFVITGPAPLELGADIEELNCNGDSDGAIDITVTGGTGPYTYQWSNTAGTQDISGLSAGVYQVTVTDANDCSLVADFEVTEPTNIVISESIINVACKGENTGSIATSLTGGRAPYSYLWSNGATTPDVSNLPAGTYTLTVTDAAGCKITENYNVSEPSTFFSIESFTETQPSCSGLADGALKVNATGGNAPYRYLWSTGATSETISGLKAGTYSATVTDANGCSKSLDYSLGEPLILDIASAVENVSCHGAQDGKINITVTGGSSPYTYQWSQMATTEDISGLAAGAYSVTVTDANGCSINEAFDVAEPTAIIVTESISHVSCKGESTGAITTTVAGGSGTYAYSWLHNGLAISTDSYIEGVSEGSYVLTVTDHTGCQVSHTYTITEPASVFSIESFGETPVTCAGGSDGSVTVSVLGGNAPYSYQWSNNETTPKISGLKAGTYTVTVTDANGCSRTADYVLSDPIPMVLSSSVTAPSCNGGSDGGIIVSASNGTGPYRYTWDNGITGSTLDNIPAGEYTVLVEDHIGCTLEQKIIVTEPELVISNAVVNQISCHGEVDGSVVLAATGGVGPYTYHWSNGTNADHISGLTSGTYSVTISDSRGCSVYEEYVISEPNQLAASSTSVNILCKNDNTGTIDLTVTGGTLPYSYLWSNGETTEDLSGLSAGDYNVKITDANGCAIMESVTITEPATALKLVSTVQQITCYGGSNGAISLEVTGGEAPYTYFWSNGSNSEDLDDLGAGTYTVQVTDKIGCQKSLTFEISEPPVLEVSGLVTDISCFGASDGAVDLTVTGGEAPYTIAWAHGATGEDISGLIPGSYSVLVTDKRGCQESASFTIAEPKVLAISSTKTDVDCKGAASGSIDVTITGGTLPYSFSWSDGSDKEDLTGISAGTYTLIVSDGNGCKIEETVVISEPAEGITVTESISHIGCAGDRSGGIDLTVTGGTGAYTYSWSNGATTQDIDGLTAGVYEVTLSDQKGCAIQKTYVVSSPEPLALTQSVTHLSCFETGDGAIDISISGGNAPYSYLWSNGETAEDLSGLSAGDYSVTVTDASGCGLTSHFTLSQPQELVVEPTAGAVSCFGQSDGSIGLEVTGGVAPYTYSWSTGSTAKDLEGLAGGVYSVTVTDATGCRVSSDIIVDAPTAALSATGVISNISCNGDQTGSVSLTVTGGTAPYTYSWSNGNTLRDLLSAYTGSYTVVITDAHNCTFSASYEISQSEAIEATFTTTEPNCSGDSNGSILLEVSGGTGPYTYHWSNGSTSKDQYNLVSGPYSVAITDKNNCTITQSVLLGSERGLDIEVTKTDVSCKGGVNGAITLDVYGGSGNYVYEWSHGATTKSLSGLLAGIYLVEVRDEDGCSSSVTVNIAEPSQSLALSVDHTDKLVCFGGADGTALANPTGGTAPYQYLWSTGERSQQISDLSAGAYNVIVTDFLGCVTQQSFQIEEPSGPISISVSGKTYLDCFGDADGSIKVSVNGGEAPYRLLWNNGVSADNLTDLSAGDYTLIITDSRGCRHEEVVSITQPEALRITDFIINDTDCYGDRTGSVELQVAGGTGPYTYLWSNETTSRNLIGVGTGSYEVLITDATGCTIQSTFELNNAPFFDLMPDLKEISCPGEGDGSISLNITGGNTPYTILWNTGQTAETITNLSEGEYSVLVTDGNGCSLEQTFVITEPLPLALEASVKNAEACDNPESGSIDLMTTGGWAPYVFSWSHGATSPNLENLAPGFYTVTVTDRLGCSIMETYQVTQPDAIDIHLTAQLISDCEQKSCYYRLDAGVTGGFGNYQYRWSKGNSTGAVAELNDPGRITLLVTDARGCQRSASLDITLPEFGDPNFTFESEGLEKADILAMHDPIQFLDLSEGDITDWEWSFGDGFKSTDQNPVHTFASMGTYEVSLSVTDIMGCTNSYVRDLIVEQGFTVMVPNAFTPDGDGLNDSFRPHTLGLEKIQWLVFNTWGEVIFETDDIESSGWDGTVNGKPAVNGNYIYKLTGVCFNGSKVERDGVFALIK